MTLWSAAPSKKKEMNEMVRNMAKKSNISPATKRVRSSRESRAILWRSGSLFGWLEISFLGVFFSVFFVAMFQQVKSFLQK